MTQPADLYFDANSTRGTGAVSVTWLGTAGFAIEHDDHVLVLDPYLTRSSFARCILAPLQPDRALAQRLVPRADAIVLSHTHFDHALDTPFIARQTGARVFGSRSAITLCLGQGVPPEQLESVESTAGSAPYTAEVGPFRLRFWPSAHSAFLFGRVPFPGEITDCSDVPLRTNAYRCGAVFGTEIEVGGRRLFHVGSAELVESGWRLPRIETVLACVAGWTSTERYPERLMRALSPQTVVFHHWDNFLRGIDLEAHALPAMRFPNLVDRLTSVTRDVKIGALPLLGSLQL